MYTSWIEAQKAGRSPLNVGRSLERNKRKQIRSRENVEYRRSLHQQKETRGNPNDRNTVQDQINEISKRR
jgi:hypothetical protein